MIKEPLPYYPGMTFKTADLPMFQSLIDQNTPIICEDTANISFDEGGKQKDYFMSRGSQFFFCNTNKVDNE
jgi:hypothetical protein